ncbi:hypothetical protein KI387_022936, partial [Taxus chinensis]
KNMIKKLKPFVNDKAGTKDQSQSGNERNGKKVTSPKQRNHSFRQSSVDGKM